MRLPELQLPSEISKTSRSSINQSDSMEDGRSTVVNVLRSDFIFTFDMPKNCSPVVVTAWIKYHVTSYESSTAHSACKGFQLLIGSLNELWLFPIRMHSGRHAPDLVSRLVSEIQIGAGMCVWISISPKSEEVGMGVYG